MNACSRAGLATVSLLMALATPTLGQDLRLSSIRIVENNVIELSLADPPQGSVNVEATADFGSWVKVTNGTPDSRGVLAVVDPALGDNATFFRVSTDGPLSDRFVATINADYAGGITNATVTVVASGKTFATDSNGRVSIPVSELEFESGFRLKVDAPGFVSETIDLPPALYSYTFSLTPVALAPTTVVGRTYSLESNTITLYDTGMFRLETTNGISSGGYFVERSTTIADTWSIKTAAPDGYLGIELTFNSEAAGRYTNVVVDGTTVSGDFEQVEFVAGETNQPVAAPASLKTVRFVTLDTPVGAGLDFTVTLTGEGTGTFVSSGTFSGHGTFTYTPGAQTTLRMEWADEFEGDYDDFALKFVEGAGLGTKANLFTGMLAAHGWVGEVQGTFSYE